MAADSLNALPCSVREDAGCEDCELRGKLMCRFDGRDMAAFAGGFIPFAAVVVSGMILGRQGIFLLGWLAYAVLFFFVWEARVLCRHCPYWASGGHLLRCHANYGVIKIWAFEPTPIGTSEGLQFVAGAIIFLGYPFPFLVIGGQYIMAAMALPLCMVALTTLWTRACSRCVNFSCPLNHAQKCLLDAYLERNPVLAGNR